MQRSREFLVEIARKYYIDELSQQEIARDYGLSRPTVSNILKQCREEGVVEIRIKDGSPLSEALGERLKKKYGLETVIIIGTEADDSATLSRLGAEAAAFASSIIRDGMQIGIAWGTSLYQMVNQMEHLHVTDVSVVQLMGGLGANNPQYDGSELASRMSRLLNARYYPMQCPVLVKSTEMRSMLMKEPGIAEALKHTEEIDTAFVGLSSNEPERSSLVRAGILTRDEALELVEAGAVGHICGYSYDRNGRLLDAGVNKRIIGIEFGSFLGIPNRIGVACGKGKAEAIAGALEGGMLTALITDESAALRILSN